LTEEETIDETGTVDSPTEEGTEEVTLSEEPTYDELLYHYLSSLT
jgi:hypothetical protein